MPKISYAAFLCLAYQLISAQFALEMCLAAATLAARNCQKIHQKLLFWRSRSFKVVEFNGNRKPVDDFLLVINSNLGFISHRY